MRKYWSLSESPISDEAQIFEYINDVPFAHFTIGSTVYARRIVEALNSAPELLKENEQLKKQIKSVEKVSYETSKANADYMVKNEHLKESLKTYQEDKQAHLTRIETLKEQVKVLREALDWDQIFDDAQTMHLQEFINYYKNKTK